MNSVFAVPFTRLMRALARGVCGVVDVTNKFTQTAEVLWTKKDGMATL